MVMYHLTGFKSVSLQHSAFGGTHSDSLTLTLTFPKKVEAS